MFCNKSRSALLVVGVLLLTSSRLPVLGADEPRALKVFASQSWSNASSKIGPLTFVRKSTHDKATFVIRTAKDLAAVTWEAFKEPKNADDAVLQKEVADQFAKLLKVDRIDWDKQMVIAIWDAANVRGPRGGVEFVSFNVQGNQLTVRWKLDEKRDGSYPVPRGVALVDRFDGTVVFSPSAEK